MWQKGAMADLKTVETIGLKLGKLSLVGFLTVLAVNLSFSAPALAAEPNLFLQGPTVSVGEAGWQSAVSANPGDELGFQLIIHNDVSGSVAENTTLKVALPEDAGGSLTVTTTVSTSTPTSKTASASGSVTVSIPSGARLKYRQNSLRLTWDTNGDGTKDYSGSPWPAGDSALTSSGVNFGSLSGCDPYVIQLLFAVDVIGLSPPKLTLDKKVRFGGLETESIAKETHLFDPGEKIEYRLFVANSGEQEAKKVKIDDPLPPYLKWVEGDGSYDRAANRVDFDLGTVKAGEARTLGYTAQVVSDVPEGQYSQDNIAGLFEDGQKRDEGRAFVWVSSGPKAPEGEILATATELPTTGVDGRVLEVAALAAAIGAVGVFLRRLQPPAYRHFKVDHWR